MVNKISFIPKNYEKNYWGRNKNNLVSQWVRLILKKMKAKGIEVGSGVPNKKYDNEEVYELIHIAKCFPELREKDN